MVCSNSQMLKSHPLDRANILRICKVSCQRELSSTPSPHSMTRWLFSWDQSLVMESHQLERIIIEVLGAQAKDEHLVCEVNIVRPTWGQLRCPELTLSSPLYCNNAASQCIAYLREGHRKHRIHSQVKSKIRNMYSFKFDQLIICLGWDWLRRYIHKPDEWAKLQKNLRSMHFVSLNAFTG